MTNSNQKMSNYRWTVCVMLLVALTINYLDRQVLGLTWKEFIQPEFHWTDSHYGWITATFSLVYAIAMLFAGRFVDWLGTKKGFLWAIFFWSIGACLHALTGIGTSGFTTGNWLVGFEGARESINHFIEMGGNVGLVINISVVLMIFSRIVLAIGEAGNFPASIKATAEYFPKKDRALATAIFNAGSTIGALAAPLTIPLLAKHYGWEMSFIIIGALGFLWMGWWTFGYEEPKKQAKVNEKELEYILQDKDEASVIAEKPERKLSWIECFKFKQTWSFAFGKFMTDGVWMFLLFWLPAYLADNYGLKMSDSMGRLAIFTVYAIVMISIFTGGYLPKFFMEKKGMNPYAGRMRAMLIFAFFPLLALLAQPLGMKYSLWFPVIIIGIAGAAHQSWSANLFSTVSDMIPKSAVATVIGIGGMAGGVGSFFINLGFGFLSDYAHNTGMTFMGFTGKPAGYFIIFCFCAVAYLIGWAVMKTLVPKYKLVEA